MNFTPLHVYSGYSFQKSGLKIDAFLDECTKRGFTTVGISEYETLTSAPVFFHEAQKRGLKPIIGEDYEVDNLLFSFFVLNETGYKNLLKLGLEIKNEKATVDTIREYQEGLAIVLTTKQDRLITSLNTDEQTFARKFAKVTRGLENFYIGIDCNDDVQNCDHFREFAFSHGYKLIAFPWIKYVKKEDAIILEMMRAIETKEVLEVKELSGNDCIPEEQTLTDFYKESEISALEEIISKVDFDLIKPRGKMISWVNEEGLNSDEYLEKIAKQGLQNKGKTEDKYTKRLDYELSIIKKMGYSDYFLIVQDYINFARSNDIAVGPGRGSAAGSLVSYALGITIPDPLEHNLLFERFLNPARQTMPDIDVDFSDIHREEVVDYLREKYGANRIARIMAVQKMGAKAALNDVGRIFNYEKHDIELFTKLIKDDGDDKLTLRELYKTNVKFRDLVNNDKYYLDIVSLASKIEGTPRQASLHAVGIVLNADPLADVIPLSNAFDGGYVEEFEKDYIEEQGFLKMDILALRNLTIIENCLALLKLKGINLDRDEIPYNDEAAIKMIASTKTMGLFQLESAGMRNAIKTLKIKTFEDVVALLALYRPGPMDSIKDYANKKNSGIKPTYLSPALEEILAPTYGTIVYQEQIMQIASKMAGFTLGEADSFRRAVSKKDKTKLESLRNAFVTGAMKKGYKQKEATDVFNLIDKFANYGFNRSHSLVYAIFSLRMAYLKAHYPQEFYASILSNASSTEFNNTIAEMKSLNIKVICPDINESGYGFKLKGNSILFPLTSVKSISVNTAESIIKERELGPFTDLCDFVSRMKKYRISDTQLMSLINSGAFDSIEPSRATLRFNTAKALNYAMMVCDDSGNLNMLLQDFKKPNFERVEDDYIDNLYREYEVLGLMVSGSPIDVYKDEIAKLGAIKLSQIPTSKGDIKTVVMIKTTKKITTKDKKEMAFVTVYDESLELETTIFTSLYDKVKTLLVPGKIVVLTGYYKSMREEFSVTNMEELKYEQDLYC